MEMVVVLCENFTRNGCTSEYQDHNLDYEELLGSGQYKESYRADMIRWGEMKRQQDSGFFCRLAIKHATQPVWVWANSYLIMCEWAVQFSLPHILEQAWRFCHLTTWGYEHMNFISRADKVIWEKPS